MEDDNNNQVNDRLDDLEQKIARLTVEVERLSDILSLKKSVEIEPETPAPDIQPTSQQSIAPASYESDTAETSQATPSPPAIEKEITLPKKRPPIIPESRPYQPSPQAKPLFQLKDHMKTGEYWLNRIGIALLLFGVVFLFKYSIDNGWLTPWIRIAFGFTVGLVALFFGFKIYGKRKAFATTLLGAGFGIWYITGFSAYQLLDLISHTTAFGYMIFVTACAFSLSLKQEDAVLSVIAVIGGFGTPFLLYNAQGNLPGLIFYTSIIIACGLGIYFFKGWRSILWLSAIGGWIVFDIGIEFSIPLASVEAFGTRLVSQLGLAFAWLGFWLVPFTRELIPIKQPERWQKTLLGFGDSKLKPATKDILDRHLHMLVISSPLLGLALSRLVWPNLSSENWGWITLGLTALYFGAAYLMRNIQQFKTLKYIHILLALSLFNLSLVLLLDGNVLLFSIATEAMLLHLLSERISDKFASYIAHILHFVTALWMASRLLMLVELYQAGSFFDGQTLTDLWVILTFTITAFKQKNTILMRAYSLVAIGTLAAVIIQELSGNIELFMITSEALVVFFIYRFNQDQFIEIAYNIVFGIAALLIGLEFFDYYHQPEYGLNLLTLTNLWCALGAYLVFVIEEKKEIRRFYLLALLLLFGMIIMREFKTNLEYALLVLEAGIALYLTKSSEDKIFIWYSHIFFGILAGLFLVRFTANSVENHNTVILNWPALANLWFVVMVTFISRYVKNKDIQLTYRFAAHIAFLTFLGFELSRLDNGQGWISLSWGVYGIILLLIGLRMNIQRFRLVGMGTLLLLVGKLFLVDLAHLETIWRVLLFIGFGGIFLVLSYYFKSLWKKDTKQQPE